LARILIINRSQFGYHTDYFQFTKYLSEEFDVTHLCWDYGRNKFSLDGVKVIYISRNIPKVKRYLNFIKAAVKEAKKPYDIILFHYFPFSSFLLVARSRKSIILDIRTSAISTSKTIQYLINKLIWLESMMFKNVTIISPGVGRFLKIKENKFHVVPLGAVKRQPTQKSHEAISLLYIGTLHKRRIEETIKGFAQYLKKAKLPAYYTIVGSGYSGEESKLKALVKELGITSNVNIAGYVPQTKLGPLFDTHNVGMSYVPMTAYFDPQPATKTYEYLLSGLPVIATATTANREVINETNGVLIKDSVKSVAEGLLEIEKKLNIMDPDNIQKGALKYEWEGIVRDNLEFYIRNTVLGNIEKRS